MVKNYHAITPTKLTEKVKFAHTAILPALVYLDDPALNAMVDFKRIQVMTVDLDSPLCYARLEMQACNVHMLLVVDNQKLVNGIITSEEILGNKPIRISQEKNITQDELKVRMVMQPCSNILALPYDIVRQAKVGNIVQTLKDHQQHYALVVEESNGGDIDIRGMFSLSNIGRQLHINLLDNDLMAINLADLQKKLKY